MEDSSVRLNQPGKPYRGTSDAAARRAQWRLRGTLHVAGHPGEVITMAREARYVVREDGSFRREKVVNLEPAWLKLKRAKALLKKAA